MKEEWRKVVVDGKENEWYSISNYGNLVSHLRKQIPKRDSLGRIVKNTGSYFYDPSYSCPINPQKRGNRSTQYFVKKMTFPVDFFDDYSYSSNNSITCRKTVSIHKLVMDAFKPIDLFPPDRLKECWSQIPDEAKKWINETIIINHIDHNPQNNCIDNLEWVTHRENTRAAVEYYGGQCANKGKLTSNKDCIKISDAVYIPLLDEYEQTIEFIGEEGDECYRIIEDIMKRENKTFKEVWFDIIEFGVEELKRIDCLPEPERTYCIEKFKMVT